MSVCVLDASFVFSWLFEDEASADADAMLALIAGQGAVVPSLWHVEVANGLGMAERRQRVSSADVQEAIALIEGLPLVIDETTSAHAFGPIIDLMRTYRLTAYDAVYLELALRRGLPLATNDRELRRAATASGIALLPTGA